MRDSQDSGGQEILPELPNGRISPAENSLDQVNLKRHTTIKDNVIIGSGAQILGPITVGDNARIGANTVILKDVPQYGTMVGNPAKNINKEESIDKKFKPYGVNITSNNENWTFEMFWIN